jgi:hypothetical protein
VNELAVVVQAQLLQLLFEKVLDSLNIVVGNALDLLYVESILHSKVGIELAKLIVSRLGYARKLRKRKLAQSDEILDLNANTVANKCVLRKII